MREIGSFRYRRHWWTVHLASQRELRAEFSPRSRKAWYRGLCDIAGRRILLYNRMGDQLRRWTFYHELLHMIGDAGRLRMSHAFVDELGAELGTLLTFDLPRNRK